MGEMLRALLAEQSGAQKKRKLIQSKCTCLSIKLDIQGELSRVHVKLLQFTITREYRIPTRLKFPAGGGGLPQSNENMKDGETSEKSYFYFHTLYNALVKHLYRTTRERLKNSLQHGTGLPHLTYVAICNHYKTDNTNLRRCKVAVSCNSLEAVGIELQPWVLLPPFLP